MSESTLITQRFKEFDGSKEYKSDLQSSLFGVMKEGEFFKLKRNKVMIKNTTSNTKDKFIMLKMRKRTVRNSLKRVQVLVEELEL